MENEEWSAECAERAENGEWRTGVESGEWRWRVASGDREWSVYIMFPPCCLLRDALNLRELRGMCVHSGSWAPIRLDFLGVFSREVALFHSAAAFTSVLVHLSASRLPALLK